MTSESALRILVFIAFCSLCSVFDYVNYKMMTRVLIFLAGALALSKASM